MQNLRRILVPRPYFSGGQASYALYPFTKDRDPKVVEETAIVEALEESESAERRLQREAEIEAKRNKSGLRPHHHNVINGRPPFEANDPKAWYHERVKYKRKLFGTYGVASGVDPAVCWPTKEELEDIRDYEQVAHPSTILEMREKALKLVEEQREKILAQDRQMQENMKELGTWMRQVRRIAAEKLQAAEVAKAKREKLIEEVKRHFGYRVDPKEDKFQMMIEEKEKLELKKQKQDARKAREQEFLDKLAALEAGARDKETKKE